MDNPIVKVDDILSFTPNPDSDEYTLTRVCGGVRKGLIALIEKLERIPQVYLCARGDSKDSLVDHDLFFTRELSSLFIVGAKARSNINTPVDRNTHFETDSPCWSGDLASLIEQVNKEITNKPKAHHIEGTISEQFVDKLRYLDKDSLERWKIFFLAFLHNNGVCREFKRHSPMLSVAYGAEKYRVARCFALSRRPDGKGIVFLYALNAEWPYYIRTRDFTDELKRYGVKWYPDNNHEIMLINGMYPHFLLGVFEVTKRRTPRFIINPWLYEILLNNGVFDYSEGLNIDQANFKTEAIRLKYSNFFFHLIGSQNEYVSELSQFTPKRVYKP